MDLESWALEKNAPGYFRKVFTYALCIAVGFSSNGKKTEREKLRFDLGHAHTFTVERKTGHAYYTQTTNFKINNIFVRHFVL